MINPDSLNFIEFTKSHIATIHPWFEDEGSNWVEEPTAKFVDYVDSVEHEYNKYLVYDKDLPVAYVLFGIEDGRSGIALVINPAVFFTRLLFFAHERHSPFDPKCRAY
jgi:hypothetical protein